MPKRNEKSYAAEKLFLNGMKLVEIASQLNVPEGTVRRWKSTYGWGCERSGKKSSERSDKKKRKPGGQPGNKNATGPPGNQNARKHGLFSKYLPADTQEIIENMPLDPLEIIWTFVCYGLDVERTPLFAVRYPKYRIGIEERVSVEIYTDTQIIRYKPCNMTSLHLVEEKKESHSWGEVPITEYSPDRYRQGGYEDVVSLIDLYDSAQSDTANYMTDLNEATLVISGDLDLSNSTFPPAKLVRMLDISS